MTPREKITEINVGGRSPDAVLYDAYAQRLQRIVASQVNTARENVEDACHFAWVKYLSRSQEIKVDSALSWLSTTAIRQAWKLDLRQRREPSLDAASEQTWELPIPSPLPGPVERAEHQEQLDQLAQLSERQQRLVWLKAAGLSYLEMAAYTGDSVRTVERQILRATSRIRALHTQRDASARQLGAGLNAASGPRALARQHTHDDRGIER